MGDGRALELHVPQEALEDGRDRLRRTRWPEAETASMPDNFPMLEAPDLYVDELRRGLGPMPW